MKMNHTAKKVVSAIAIAGALATASLGFGAATAIAEPEPQVPVVSEIPPAWAPPKPAETWQNQPVVWINAWGGRWGVWINGGFIPLSSNPVTGGG